MSRRRLRRRTIAALLALLVQGGLIAVLVQSRAPQARREAEVPYMVWLEPPQPPEPEPEPLRAQRERYVVRSITPESTSSIGSSEFDPRATPEDSGAITAPPARPIDWYAEMAAAIMRSAAAEDQENPLKSKPHVLELPKDTGDDKDITVFRRDNQDIVTRQKIGDTTVECTHRQPPLMAQFDPSVKNLPALCRGWKSSKPLDMEGLKPRYLRKPLPVPDKARGSDPGDNKP